MTDRFVPPVPAVPPRALPFFSYLRAVRTNALSSWPREAYEQDIHARHLFGRHMFVLNAPNAIHHVLVANPENYLRTPASIRVLRPITGKGLLLSEGEAWRLQRRTIAPALAPRTIPLLLRHVVTATAEAVADLAAHPGEVDLLTAMQHLALEIAGRSMFSMETRRFGAEMRGFLARYAVRMARPYMLDMLLPLGIPTPLDIFRSVFRLRWMRFIERIMHARLQTPEPETPRDLFDLLRAARDPETGRGFAPAELRDQVATLILAGHETTAVALFWSLYLLANAPEIQDRVAAEAARIEITPDTATAALEKLDYTRAVLHEALRLFPPAFTLVRQARSPDRSGALEIPGGSVVMIAPWVLHRHQKLWHDPQSFDPTRFLPGAPPIPRFAYLPFGAGPRICVGAQFALAEATLVLASMARAFRITMAPGTQVMPVAIITTQPDHPAPFRLTRRAPAAG